MSDKTNKQKDIENFPWDIISLNASSATELTGLIPSAPTSYDEIESYNELMTFNTNDIVAKGNENNQNKSIKTTRNDSVSEKKIT